LADEVVDLAIKLTGDSTSVVGAYNAQTAAGEKSATAAERAAGVQVASAKRVAQAQSDVGRKVAIAGGVMVAGFALAVGASMSFQKQMSEVGAVSGATAAQMHQLSDAALKAGADTVFSANDAAKAEAELAKGGLSVADIIGGGLTGAMSLASAGQLDVARSAEITATALSQFKLRGEEASHVADLLAAGANKALGSVDDLAQGLKYVGPVAAGMGVSIEQTVGVLSELAQAGIKGEQGGTSLRGVLSSLTSPSAAAAAEMSRLNITMFDASGKFIGLDGAAQQLHDGLSRLTEKERSNALGRIFGNQQITAARVLYEGGAKSVQQWTDAVNKNGYAADLAAKKMDNLAGDVENLKGSIDTALIQGGSKANGVLRVLTQTATSLVNGFSALPGPVQTAITIFIAATGVVALLGGGAMVAAVKVRSLRAELELMGPGGQRASSAIGTLGSVAGKLAGPLAIATVAFTIWSQKQAEAKQRVQDFTQAIEADSGALGTNTRALVAHRLQADGVTAAAAKMGIPLNLVTDAALGNAAAFKQVDTAIHAYQGSSGDANAATFKLITGIAKVSEDAQKGAAAQKDIAAATKETTTATGGATSAATVHAAAVKQQRDAVVAAAKAIRDQSDAMRAQTDPVFAVTDALLKQRDAQSAAAKAAHDHGVKSKEYTTANLDAFKATVDLSGAVRAMKASLTDGSTSVAKVNAQLDSFVKAGLISAAQAGALKAQVAGVVTTADKLAGSLGVVVPSVKNAGKNIGKGLADGVVEGIRGAMGSIVHQAQTMGAAAVGAARQGAQVFSPSKATMYVGEMLGEGLIVGMRSRLADVKQAALELAVAATGTGAPGTVSLADVKAAQARANETPVERAQVDDLNASSAVNAALAKVASVHTTAASAYDAYATAAHKAAAADAALSSSLQEQRKDTTAADAHARALRADADAAARRASAMPSHTAAERAAKQAAEAHAQALSAQAREATRNATALRQHDAGMVASARAAAAAADAAASKAKSTYLDARNGAIDAGKALTDALTAATQAHAALADAVYAEQLEQAKSFTDSVSAQLDQLVQKANDLRGSFSSAATAGSDLGSIFAAAGDGSGIVSVTDAIAALQSKVTGAEGLRDLMAQLQSAGLSDTLVKQISDEGVTTGSQIAQAILAGGPEAIASLDDLSSQLADVASSGLDQVVAGFYGSGASAIEQLVAGVRAGFPELDAVLAEVQGKVAGIYGTTPQPTLTAIPTPAAQSSTTVVVQPQQVTLTLDGKQIAEATASYARDELREYARLNGKPAPV
jgi:TP901 family phage tail tape measure protein